VNDKEVSISSSLAISLFVNDKEVSISSSLAISLFVKTVAADWQSGEKELSFRVIVHTGKEKEKRRMSDRAPDEVASTKTEVNDPWKEILCGSVSVDDYKG
jgi:hypothetical protein